VELEHLRQRAEFHPLIEGVHGNVLADGELGVQRLGPTPRRT
jgi:hypothetical protein